MLPLQPRQGEARQRRAGPSNTGSLPADSGRLQLMVVPSTACPARCRYCFGPHASLGVMEPGTVDAIIRFLHSDGSTRGPVEITFHGGEPLVAGRPFYEDALPRFRQGLGFRAAGFAIQSNLWLITDELCGLFREHGVSIGTSLDGPRDITDRQRGEGYFDRTMAGIEMARRHGMEPA